MTWLITVIGWVGAGSVLLAYLLLLRRSTSAESRLYLTLNFLGSACLAVSTSAAHAWPSAAANLTWLAIGIVPLIRAWVRLRARPRRPALACPDNPAPSASPDNPAPSASPVAKVYGYRPETSCQ
jgi:hypothetical protein